MSVTKVSSITFPVRTRCYGVYAFGAPFDLSATRTVTAVRTRTGERLPKWHKVIEQGGNATTPLTAYYDTIRADKSTYSYEIAYNGAGTATFTGAGDLFLQGQGAPKAPRTPTIDTTKCDNRARQNFYSKLRGCQVQFQGLVFAGELRETLRMIKSPGQALRRGMGHYLDELKKRKKKDPRNWARSVGGTYLEHAFGWKPFLRDIEDGYKAYKALTDKKISKMISASAIVFEDRSSSLNGISPWFNSVYRAGPGNYDYFYSQDVLEEQCQIRYKGLYKAEVSASQWQNAKNSFGFKPEEFVTSVWELLPWSWLIDYFANIGDLLNNSVTSTQGVLWVNRTQRRTARWYGSASFASAFVQAAVGAQNKLQNVKTSLGSFEVTRRELIRSPNSGIPLPSLEFGTPGSGQLANIAALLGTAFDLHPQSWRKRFPRG